MKTKIVVILLCLSLFSCSANKKVSHIKENDKTSTENILRDGSSLQKAVIIKEKSETKGVDAEYIWIRTYYPDCKVIQQTLVHDSGKPYDFLKIKTVDGKDINVYFDISNFYGHF